MNQPPIPVTGAWLRLQNGKAEMLLEFNGAWHLVSEERLLDGEKTVSSHIVEPLGIKDSPIDRVAHGDQDVR